MSESHTDKRLERDLDRLAAIASIRHLAETRQIQPIREAAGLTQADLARVTGCTPSSIAKYEAGDRTPSGDRALRLAGAVAKCLELADADRGEQ